MSAAEQIAFHVRKVVDAEFSKLDGQRTPLHSQVVALFEKPLFQAVLNHYRGNQSHTALALGINRNTLKKKMQEYGIAF